MAGLFKDGYLRHLCMGNVSDLIIECGDAEFKVHKIVVCAASSMLSAACNGSFEESQTGRVKFPEEDPDIMARVILFLYTGIYQADQVPNFKLSTAGDVPLLTRPSPIQDRETPGQVTTTDFKRVETETLIYKLAAKSVLDFAEKWLRHDGITPILQLVYDSTHGEDQVLRSPLTTLCFHNHMNLAPTAIKFMEEHERLLWTLAVPLVTTLQQKNDQFLKVTVPTINSVYKIRSRCSGCSCSEIFEVGDDGSITRICEYGHKKKVRMEIDLLSDSDAEA